MSPYDGLRNLTFGGFPLWLLIVLFAVTVFVVSIVFASRYLFGSLAEAEAESIYVDSGDYGEETETLEQT